MFGSESESASGSDSNCGPDKGLQRANTSAAGASRASQSQRHGHPSQYQVNATQTQSNNTNEVQRMLAAITIEYPPRIQAQSAASTVGSTRSRTSSMAVSTVTRSTIASGGGSSMYSAGTLPSLSTSASTAQSGFSVKTGSVGQQYKLDSSDDEDSEDGSSVHLECVFGFLRCPHVFTDVETWDRHCRTHYRGTLPSTARCPFPRCDWAMSPQQGQDIWAHRMRHMQHKHSDEGFEYPRGRPDSATIEGLYRARMIDAAQYQELRRNGRLSEQSVLITASRRQERQDRRRIR